MAAAGAASQGLAQSRRPFYIARVAAVAAISAVAIEFSGAIYAIVGGTSGVFVWPVQILLIAIAFVAYVAAKAVAVEVVVPLATTRRLPDGTKDRLTRPLSMYIIGAGMAYTTVPSGLAKL